MKNPGKFPKKIKKKNIQENLWKKILKFSQFFRPPRKHLTIQSAHPNRSRSTQKQPLEGKEFVKIITRDGVRNLLIPRKFPNSYNEFWSEKELERLQTKAKVLTVEDKMRELQNRVEDNKKLREESELRKQRLKVAFIEKIWDFPVFF